MSIDVRAAGGQSVAGVPRTASDTTLVDLLDRVIDRGVAIQGDIVLSVADVDLVHIGLRLVLRGIDGR